MAEYSPSTLVRFWAKVDVRGLGECWPWMGSTTPSGYGELRLERSRKKKPAHVISYEIKNGAMPSGLLACHTCDNPPCCNPGHLFSGSHKDNAADASAKGRLRTGPSKGSQNANSRLTEDDVRQIRVLITAGHTNMAIGAKYGVTHSMVSMIRRGLSWTHI